MIIRPRHRFPAARLWLAALALSLTACTANGVGSLEVTGLPSDAVAGTTLDLSVVLKGAVEGTLIKLNVPAGGGSIEPAELKLNDSGTVPVKWTLGPAPVSQQLRVLVEATDGTAEAERVFTLDTQVTSPLGAEAFGDVDSVLTSQKVVGSTEDLAFSPSGDVLIVGIPGGLAKVGAAGKTTVLPTTGDAIVQPLGVAYDDAGRLWICDSQGKALRRMAKDGKVSTIVDKDEGAELGAPNHLAVLPNGDVIFSDPCLGKLMWVDGKTGTVKARHTFDLATEGGPNGVALAPDGETLYVTTENTALLCNHAAKLAVDKPVAGLFKLPLTGGEFGKRTTVAAGIGLFGDGLAFDVEGNLYVCLDRVKDFKLQESAIEVLPKGGDKLRPFLRATDHIYANVLFGSGTFGATKLYIALLSVPPFTEANQRGLMRVDVGIAGQSLGHVAKSGD
ncbi:MAG: SMP-30/gluconolactonase/LRE family protein [Myxococcales bacterium]|nr:SMP-30/gluconolactonase/LRE family protein [Myxococcales bacterium]